eukprot:Gb_38906 [translate_table: standard]
MGNSRFKLSHVMPNVWFYKLRDIGRIRDRRLRQARKHSVESAITLPRNSYHFGRAERIYASPVNPKASDTPFPEQAKQKQPIGSVHEIEPRKKNKGTKSSRSRSSTVIDSRITASCSCRTTVGSVWKSRDKESSSESSDESPVSVERTRSKQPVVENYSNLKQDSSTAEKIPKQKRLDSELSWNFPSHRISQSKTTDRLAWKQRSKHVLQYGSNNVAGLPSPVYEEDEDSEYEDLFLNREQLDENVEHLVRTVKELFELVRDPFVDTCSITCSSSCSCRLDSSALEIMKDAQDNVLPSTIADQAKDINGNFITAAGKAEMPFLNNSPDFSHLIVDTKQKQRFVEDMEESKPSLIRRSNSFSQAEVKSMLSDITEAKTSKEKQQFSETICLQDDQERFPAASNSSTKVHSGKIEPRKKLSASVMNSDRTVLDKAPTAAKSILRKARGKSSNQRSAGQVAAQYRKISSPKKEGSYTSHTVRPKQRQNLLKSSKMKGNSPATNIQISEPKVTICSVSDSQLSKFDSDDDDDDKHVGESSISTVSESFAVVKRSYDPQKDFRDSMVEMIIENDIRCSNDLQQLLQCYLSLNSDEYHDVIVKVFEQVWSDLTELSV